MFHSLLNPFSFQGSTRVLKVNVTKKEGIDSGLEFTSSFPKVWRVHLTFTTFRDALKSHQMTISSIGNVRLFTIGVEKRIN